MTIRIAAVACLDESRSVHSVTFKRAIASYRHWLEVAGLGGIEVHCHDDGANADLARQVAAEIIDTGVDAVVGHFASAAAAAAAPLYAVAGMPLFLPAATAQQLTDEASTFRLCDHDGQYAAFVAEFCAGRHYRIGQVAHDGSLHGRSVAAALVEQPVSGDATTEVLLYSGNCQRSIEFLDSLDREDSRTVLLTDDALAAETLAAVARRSGPTLVLGLAPTASGSVAEWMRADHLRRYQGEPACYFWETIAALEVAVACAGCDPASAVWPSVLGEIRFDARGETNLRAFAAYRPDGDAAVPRWTRL